VLGCGVLAILGHAGSEFLAGLSTRDALPVAAYAAVLVATCGLACLVPARRALAVQPTEALRGDG
jgi:ABC-type lipoprotein release transport system permease subunit